MEAIPECTLPPTDDAVIVTYRAVRQDLGRHRGHFHRSMAAAAGTARGHAQPLRRPFDQNGDKKNDQGHLHLRCRPRRIQQRYLHGVWIDATLEVSEIQAEIAAMLKTSPVADAEEYAIHDYEGFDGYSLGEYTGIDTAHEAACFIEEYPDFGGALLSHCGDLGKAIRAAENNYCGCYTSLADYAEELTEQTSEVPEHLSRYIDYDATGWDMELGGDVFTLTTGFEEVHIFWSR